MHNSWAVEVDKTHENIILIMTLKLLGAVASDLAFIKMRIAATGKMGIKSLNAQSVNQNIVKMEYAVRGELAIRAEEIRNVIV